MCGTDPLQQIGNFGNKLWNAGKVAPKIVENTRAATVNGVETAGTHALAPIPIDYAAQAEADRIKAEQEATATANALLQQKKLRKRAGAGLLTDTLPGGNVLSSGSSSGSISVLGTGA